MIAVLCRGAAGWTNLLGRAAAAVRDEDVREGRSSPPVGDTGDQPGGSSPCLCSLVVFHGASVGFGFVEASGVNSMNCIR